MLLRLLLLVALTVPGICRGQATEFPNPPSAQVLDPGDRLGSSRRGRLEGELGRLRKQYAIDVLIILWDRSLPPETGLEELAARIGETWAREEFWAVVLHVPDSLHRPALVTGGSFLDSVKIEAAEEALLNALNRGLKERTVNAQVEALGLEIGAECVYLKNRRDLERRSYVVSRDEQLWAKEERHQKMIFRAIIATLLALVAVGTVAVLYLFNRRPKNLAFPQTRWRRRLDAPWCGGGHIVVSVPTRVP